MLGTPFIFMYYILMMYENEKEQIQNMENVVLVLQRLLEGEVMDINVGNWHISRDRPHAPVQMDYKGLTVSYLFRFKDNENIDHEIIDNTIIFENFHRQSHVPGNGTPSLKEIEGFIQRLAIRLNRKITIRFPYVKNQPDTQSWLEKLGYHYDNQRIAYYKELSA